MWCCQCQNHLSECTCEDIEERLARLRDSPNLVMQWCSVCNSHYSQCMCENPIWTTSDKMLGKEN